MLIEENGNKEKAIIILNTVKGMEICDAQELLDWCSRRLLHQPCCGWEIPSEPTGQGA